MSHFNPRHDPENVREADSKFAPKAKSKALKKAYTGHYQETRTGQIRHQSPRQVKMKNLRHGPAGMYN